MSAPPKPAAKPAPKPAAKPKLALAWNKPAKKKKFRTITVRKQNPLLIRGKGGFFSDIFASGKRLLGEGLHKGIDWLSGRAKDHIKSIIGNGDYVLPRDPVQHNSLYAPALTTPKFASDGSNGTHIQHRESLGVFKSSTGFARHSININPGLSSFPWLSNVAPAWQRYKIHGAIIEWVPRVSQVSNDASGSVILSSRYDLTTAAPASIQEAECTFGAVVGRPMDMMAMPIECKPSMTPTNVLNVRFGALPTGGNLQFFDHCIVDLCTYGMATATTNIGEMFITYDVEFQMPTAEHLTNSSSDCFAAYKSITAAAPYGGNVWTVRPGSNINVSQTGAAGSLTLVFDDVAPLPVGSVWLFDFNTAATDAITHNNEFALGTDFAFYPAAFKSAAGADAGSFATGIGTPFESSSIVVQVVGATGNQTILIDAMTITALATGYSSVLMVPYNSQITARSSAMMRARYPGLYELEDRLLLATRQFAPPPDRKEALCNTPSRDHLDTTVDVELVLNDNPKCVHRFQSNEAAWAFLRSYPHTSFSMTTVPRHNPRDDGGSDQDIVSIAPLKRP